MARWSLLAAAAVALAMVAHEATAQRGGAVRGGVRGAVAGNIVGGSEGAATGAKIGVITGATRQAIDREVQSRGQYVASPEYQTIPRSNFNEAPPEVLGTAATGTAKQPKGEAVIQKDGKPLVGVTFPADWNQKTGDNYIAAVSKDGQAYGVFVALEGVADKKAGITKVKKGLENHLKDVKYDDPIETKGGAMVITGTGKGKKAGVDVVFASGIFDAGKGQLVGAAFVVDSKIEDHYKETVSGICQTIRRAQDFGK